jgi:hypothetical protein
MSDETLITLPDAETMMSRLKEVNSESHCVERFYPLLTKEAGQERVPMGIIMMLQLAIHDYTEGMPPMMVAVLNMNMDGYIDALVPDESAAAEAKAHWAEVRAKAKAG